MNQAQGLFHWLVQYPFTTAAVMLGGAVIALVLYTYIHDYRMLIRHE